MALQATLNVCRRLYNAGLQERRDAWQKRGSKERGISISFKQQSAQLPWIRSVCEDVGNVNAQILQDVLRRLKKSFSAFFKRVKEGKKPGYPRFKSYDRFNSFTFPQVDPRKVGSIATGGIDLRPNGRLRVHGIPGELKVKWHRKWEGRPKTATFKREGNRWFLVLSCDDVPTHQIPVHHTGLSCGIDLGITDFATLDIADSATHVPLPSSIQPSPIANPRFLKHAREQLLMAQRSVSRKKRRSIRRRKAVILLAKHHAHVANQRKDFHHKLALDLVRRFDLIAVEELDVAGMLSKKKEGPTRSKKRNRGLRRSISDAGFSQFLTILSDKAESAGRECHGTPARGTTKTCSGLGGHCEEIVPKALHERVHRCPKCGLEMSRDKNAARVIRQRVYGREAAIGETG